MVHEQHKIEDMERSSKNIRDHDPDTATNIKDNHEMNITTRDSNKIAAAAAEEIDTTVRISSSPRGNSSHPHPRDDDDDSAESERLTGANGEKEGTPVAIGLTAKGYQRRFATHEYKDRSDEILEPTTKFERDAIKLYYSCQVTGPFPFKLQILLRLVEVKKLQHIIGWQPHGRSFCIRNPSEFESGLMTTFFAQTQLTSFRRQLNLYDFKRITHGPDAGSYYHELFMRGKPLHAYRIKRTKVKGTKYRSTSSPEEEPDFYSMPALPPCYDPQTAGEEQQPYLIGHLILDNQQMKQQRNPSAPALSHQQEQGQQAEQQPARTHNNHDQESWKTASTAAASSFRHSSEYPHPYSKKASRSARNTDAGDSSGFATAGGIIMGGIDNSSRMLATGFSSAAAVPPAPTNRRTTREKNSSVSDDSSSVSPSNYVSPEPSSVVGGNTSSLRTTGSTSNNSINGGSGGVTNIIAGRHPLPPMAANASFGFTPISAGATNAFPQQQHQQQSILGTTSFANATSSSTSNQNNTLQTLEQLKVLLGLGNNNDQQRNQHDLVNEAIYSLLVNTTLANEAERGYGRPGGDGIDLSALLILVQQEQQRRRQQQEQRDRQIIELLASLSSRNNLAPPPAHQRFDNAFHTNPVAGDNLLNFIRDNSQQNTNYCAAPPIGAPSDGGSTNALLLSALLQQSYPSSDHANNLMISPASSSMPVRNAPAQTPMCPQSPYFYDPAPAQNSRNGVGVNGPRGNGIPAGLGYTGRNLENLETGRSSTEGLGGLNVGADHGRLNLMHIVSAYNALHGNHSSSAGMSGGSTYDGNRLSYYSGDPMTRSSNTHDNVSSQRQL